MSTTQLGFKIIDLSGDGVNYIIDQNSIFINGYIPNWRMLHDFLFERPNGDIMQIMENMVLNQWYEVQLEIWLGGDDNDTFIDFKLLNIFKL